MKGIFFCALFGVLLLNDATQALSAELGNANRTITGFTVSIAVNPADSVLVYACEETIPEGLEPSNLNEGGTYDAGNRKIRWGPWFDNQSRMLSYELNAASSTVGNATLVGQASFDGLDVSTTGDSDFQWDLSSSGESKLIRSIETSADRLDVVIATEPHTGVLVYAVEENVPDGWTVVDVTENGAYDPANGKIKWGPYFDANPRNLTYGLMIPEGFEWEVGFSGFGSFDGVDIHVSGQQTALIEPIVLPMPPVILVELQGATVNVGDPIRFELAVSGGEPLQYRWHKDGQLISESDQPNFIIQEAALSDAGEYWVEVTNLDGSAVSGPVALKVVDSEPPVTNDGAGGENIPGTYVYIDIHRAEPISDNAITLQWISSFGTGYLIEFSETLDGPWETALPGLFIAEDGLSEMTLPIDPVGTRFYRVRLQDEVPPQLVFIDPMPSDVAVGLMAPIHIQILDEHAIDLESITLTTPDGESVLLDDPRLEFQNSILTYTPASPGHGNYGQGRGYQVNVADTLGNALVDGLYFTLELETILADGAVGIGTSAGQAVAKLNAGPSSEIITANETEVVIQYTGSAPGLVVNQIIWSNDPRFPYYWSVLGIQNDAASNRLVLQTEALRLEDVISQGSINPKSLVEIDPDTGEVLNPVAQAAFQINAGLSVGDQLTETLLDVGPLNLSASIGWNYQSDLKIMGEIKNFELTRMQIRSPQTFSFFTETALTANGSFSTADLPAEIPTSKSIFEIEKYYKALIGVVPVWVKVNFSTDIGFSVEAESSGFIKQRNEWVQQETWVADYTLWNSPSRWQVTSEGGNRQFNFSPLDWQIDGKAKAEVYLAPKIEALVYSTAGFSVDLVPSFSLEGEFQLNPPEYEWGLYANLNSTAEPVAKFWDPEWGTLPSWELFNLREFITGEAYPPVQLNILEIQGQTRMEEGKDFQFQVVTDSSTPNKVKYEWYRDDERLPVSGSVYRGKGQKALAGVYQVIADDGQSFDVSEPFEIEFREDSTAPNITGFYPDFNEISLKQDIRFHSSFGEEDAEGLEIRNRDRITTGKTFKIEANDPESGVQDYALIGIPIRFDEEEPEWFEVLNAIEDRRSFWTGRRSTQMTGYLTRQGDILPGAPDMVPGEVYDFHVFARNRRGRVRAYPGPFSSLHTRFVETRGFSYSSRGGSRFLQVDGVGEIYLKVENPGDPSIISSSNHAFGLVFCHESGERLFSAYYTAEGRGSVVSSTNDLGVLPNEAAEQDLIDYVVYYLPASLWPSLGE